MTRGTDFGGVHSSRDLHLIQQAVDVQPAAPKLNLVNIPGADGSKDLSAAPAGRVVFKDRTITWTFALYPGERWHDKHREVSGALNGRLCHITLDDDPDYYYIGRLSVDKYKKDNTLRQITVKATCRPYKLQQRVTEVTASLSSTLTRLVLDNDRMPTIPTITVTAATNLVWSGGSATLSPGTHKILDLELQEGELELAATVPGGTGAITVTYQEGAL